MTPVEKAHEEGHKDGVAWAQERIQAAERDEDEDRIAVTLRSIPTGGWDEAAIHALLPQGFGDLCGLPDADVKGRTDAWYAVCNAYNVGAEAGARETLLAAQADGAS